MIPDRPGFWWYRATWGEPDERFIMMIRQSVLGSLSGEVPGLRIPFDISNKKIVWLGPVNPEPMKASGE